MSGKTSQRRCTYNIRARSRNHCCRGQAVSITYSECVSILCPKHPACKSHHFCAVLYCHPWSVWLYHICHILSQMARFSDKNLLKNGVPWFPLRHLPRRFHQGIIIRYTGRHVNHPLFFSHFNQFSFSPQISVKLLKNKRPT
jgi:hypothetical protein